MSETPGPYHVSRDADGKARALSEVRGSLLLQSTALLAVTVDDLFLDRVLSFLDETGRQLDSLTLAELRELSRGGESDPGRPT
jgi:hypothetical protein